MDSQGPRSSAGQSIGFLIRRSRVRVAPGAPFGGRGLRIQQRGQEVLGAAAGPVFSCLGFQIGVVRDDEAVIELAAEEGQVLKDRGIRAVGFLPSAGIDDLDVFREIVFGAFWAVKVEPKANIGCVGYDGAETIGQLFSGGPIGFRGPSGPAADG